MQVSLDSQTHLVVSHKLLTSRERLNARRGSRPSSQVSPVKLMCVVLSNVERIATSNFDNLFIKIEAKDAKLEAFKIFSARTLVPTALLPTR